MGTLDLKGKSGLVVGNINERVLAWSATIHVRSGDTELAITNLSDHEDARQEHDGWAYVVRSARCHQLFGENPEYRAGREQRVPLLSTPTTKGRDHG